MNKPGRQGISESQIREAIAQLQDDGQNPSPAKVRNILGSGSYSTIGSVLSKWREEQQNAVTPEIPDPPASVHRLFRQVWSESWKANNDSHSSERTGFEAERTAWELAKSEMAEEIKRLETSLSDCQKELDANSSTTQRQKDELVEREKELAAAIGRVEALDNEIAHLREERKRSEQNLVNLSERAAKAEAMLAK